MTAVSTRPVKRTVRCEVPHGVNPTIAVTLYPGGVLGLREARRRKEYTTSLGALYARLVAAEARQGKKGRRR